MSATVAVIKATKTVSVNTITPLSQILPRVHYDYNHKKQFKKIDLLKEDPMRKLRRSIARAHARAAYLNGVPDGRSSAAARRRAARHARMGLTGCGVNAGG